jgi:hypothetical protein
MSTIPKGNSLDVDEVLSRYSNIMEVVEQQLHDAGVQTSPAPPGLVRDLDVYVTYDADSGAPLTPDDLTIFDHLVLGKLFSYWGAWTNYYENLLSAAEARVAILEEKTDVIKAALHIYYREEQNLVVDLIPHKVITDVRYVEWAQELGKAKQFKQAVMRQHAAFKRTGNQISREQTRRAGDPDAPGRGSGRGAGPGAGVEHASWGRD